MRADPNPYDGVRSKSAQGAIMITYPNAKSIRAALQSAEMERRMMTVALP
jgi:hypothetical protein